MRVCMCVWVRVLRGRVRVAQGRIQGLGPVVLCSLLEGEMGEGAVLTRSAWRAVVFHSGFLPLSASTLKCHVCEIENSFGCTNPSNCPRDFHFCTSVAVSEYLRPSRVHRKVGKSFQHLGSV